MTTRRLPIAIVFPDREPSWRAAEALFRERLGAHDLTVAYDYDDADVIPAVVDAEVLLAFRLMPNQARAARRLRWVQGFGAGTEGLTQHAALGSAIITNARGVHGDSVAEAALSMMFTLSRNVPKSVRDHDVRAWQPFNSVLLSGRTLGILGTGAIAEALAAKVRVLGMRVEGVSGTVRPIAGFDAVHARADLARVVGGFDFLVLLAPLDDDTRGILDGTVLAAMKPSAVVVNVGRGGLVDEPALIDALHAGGIAGAALDTVSEEPLPPAHPLWRAPNLLITPHNAGRHAGYAADVLAIFEHNIGRYLAGDVAGMRNLIRPAP